MSELEDLEWRDALTDESRSELNSHHVISLVEVDRPDWPRRREWEMERLDSILGVHVIEALKRGWRIIDFERWTWRDDEGIPEGFPDWVKRSVVFHPDAGVMWPVYHIRTRITVERTP